MQAGDLAHMRCDLLTERARQHAPAAPLHCARLQAGEVAGWVVFGSLCARSRPSSPTPPGHIRTLRTSGAQPLDEQCCGVEFPPARPRETSRATFMDAPRWPRRAADL